MARWWSCRDQWWTNQSSLHFRETSMYFSYVQINQCVCVFGFGSMISFNETFLVCLLETQVTVNASNIYPKDVEAPASGVEDMTRLAYLHEPGVLQNLQSRYDINEIYVSYSQVIASPCYLLLFFLLDWILFTIRHTQEAYWLLLTPLEDFHIYTVAIWWLNIKEPPLVSWVHILLLLQMLLIGNVALTHCLPLFFFC